MPNIKVPSIKVLSALTSEKEFDPSVSKLLSIIFLAIAFIITLLPYSGGNFLFIFPTKNHYIRPDFTSGVCGLLILIPLYARHNLF